MNIKVGDSGTKCTKDDAYSLNVTKFSIKMKLNWLTLNILFLTSMCLLQNILYFEGILYFNGRTCMWNMIFFTVQVEEKKKAYMWVDNNFTFKKEPDLEVV